VSITFFFYRRFFAFIGTIIIIIIFFLIKIFYKKEKEWGKRIFSEIFFLLNICIFPASKKINNLHYNTKAK